MSRGCIKQTNKQKNFATFFTYSYITLNSSLNNFCCNSRKLLEFMLYTFRQIGKKNPQKQKPKNKKTSLWSEFQQMAYIYSRFTRHDAVLDHHFWAPTACPVSYYSHVNPHPKWSISRQQATDKTNSPVLATLFYCCLLNLLYSFAITFISIAHLMRPWSLEPDGAVS